MQINNFTVEKMKFSLNDLKWNSSRLPTFRLDALVITIILLLLCVCVCECMCDTVCMH